MSKAEIRKYHIERNGAFSWVFRIEGSDKIIKRQREKILLAEYAIEFLRGKKAILTIYNSYGLIENKIEFGSRNA